tara:strand:- start:85 stop:1686 length:1602 start_codon:yes stop_codon:yes gene_type:complete
MTLIKSVTPAEIDITLGPQALLTFKEMKNQHYSALGEFVDNSIQSYLDNKEALKQAIPNYKPLIHIEVSSDLIRIEDNCAGISEENAMRAFDIGNPNKLGGIGTFGMGMKVSACWYSDTWKVETKALDEDIAKTYSVDIQKIVKTGLFNIGPKTKSAKKATPYTYITISKPHRYPRTNEVTMVRKYLADMYRWFIEDNEIDIFYNGKKLKYEVPPVKLLSEYPHEINKEEIQWASVIPKLDLGDGYWAQGFAFLRKVKANPQRGFGIFWKNKLIEGNWHDKWMPSASEYETKSDKDKYGIYMGENSAINQRLEGWLHISPKFRTAYTKNQVMWAGKEEVLKAELKKYLHQATIYHGDENAKYDFINQAKNGRWQWDPETDPIGGGGPVFPNPPGTGGNEPIDIHPLPPEVKTPEPEPIIPSTNTEKLTVRYEGTEWDIFINRVSNNVNRFVTKTDGPDGKKHGEKRSFAIEVNVAHEFAYKYFTNSGLDIQVEGITKLAVAMVIAQICSEESTKSSNSFFRHLNEILRSPYFT